MFVFLFCSDVFVLISQVLWIMCFQLVGYQHFKQLCALSSGYRYASVGGTNTGAHRVSQLKGPWGTAVFCCFGFSVQHAYHMHIKIVTKGDPPCSCFKHRDEVLLTSIVLCVIHKDLSFVSAVSFKSKPALCAELYLNSVCDVVG